MKKPNRKMTQSLWVLGSGLLASANALAAPMTFSQIPPGAGAKEPAPNIIVSVDDSGSMGWDINGCMTMDFRTDVYGNLNDPTRPAGSPTCPSRTANTNPSRMASLRAAILNTFGNPTTGDKGIISDDRIRLAWQAMWDNGKDSRPSGQRNDQDLLTAGQINTIKPFSGTHRSNFHSFITTLSPVNGTPSHKMMANVNSYMSSTGSTGPFATSPGVTGAPYLSCRRSYHILMTDGAWNSETTGAGNKGNYDGTARTLPDGTTYTTTTNQTRVYRDAWGGTKGTLADWAMANWATDFQSTLNNDVRPLFPVNANETVGGTALTKYWNPKNNPMTWQGVTQYTIGFGNSATTWNGSPTWNSTTDSTYGGDYSSLVNGPTNWQNLLNTAETQTTLEGRRASDLWHAALNGRGRYFPARTPEALENAFEDILKDILSQTAKPLVAIASNTSRLSKNGLAYVASFNSERWSGDIKAYPIDDNTGLPALTPTWKVSTLLDSTNTSEFSHSNRVVLTHNGLTGGSGSGIAFKWTALTTSQKNLLTNNGADNNTVGQERLNFLRGDRTKEQPATGGYLRQRDSRLGDIVNSNLWYVGKPLRMDTDYSGHSSFRSSYATRTPVLYAGANDGMLHGFNAQTGKEMLAYVPLGVYANLRNYTQPEYAHKYYVDGHPFAGDADLQSGTGTNWRTVLVASLGAGGKGYFALDVTNPATFNDSSAGSIVLMDNTANVDADVGYIFAAPTVDNQTSTLSQQIVKLNNDRWAVILGNGYNSSNERPVLLIQYLDGSKELKKIIANSSTGQTNGLGAPASFDVNGNGTVDVVFAGDLKGNMWKFNLVSESDTNWGVSAWSGSTTCYNSTACKPLFVAKDSGGTTRPITAAPMLMIHPQGGLQVVFGTGKDLVASDRDTTSPPRETIFSVWDLSTYRIESGKLVADESGAIEVSNGRSKLVAQTVTGTAGSGLVETSANTVTYDRTDSSAKRGWYFDLPVSGERVLGAPRFFDGPNLLFSSVVPKQVIEGETCDLASAVDRNFLTILNAISGAPPKTSVFGDEMDPSGNATRLQYGSGEFITLVDSKNRKTTAINTDYFCTGGNCDDDSAPDETCVGSDCASCTGPDCPGTTCVGPDCSCNGQNCTCVGPDCACSGPGCRGECGVTGGILDLCRSGLFGARTDWRELR